MTPENNKQGSVILPTLLIVMILVASGATYLTMSFNEFKMANRNQNLQKAINLAEAGVEKAMLAMKNDSWSGWTTVATDNYYISDPINIGFANGTTGSYKTYVNFVDASAPIVFSEGTVTSQYGNTKKQIRIDFGVSGLFMNGLTAKKNISWSGNNVLVDSYNSNNGSYDPNNPNDNGSVASMSVTAGDVSIGNGDIFGYVATGGGAPSFGPNGSLKGKDTPNGVSIDTSRIAYDFYSDFPDVPQPSTSSSTAIPASGTIGNPSATYPTEFYTTSFSNKNNDTLVVDGPVRFIVDGGWTSKGEIQVTSNGSVELYITGDLDIGGNGIVNSDGIPADFVIYGTNSVEGGQTIKMHGNGALYAAVYAPNAHIEMKGGGNSGTFMGAAVGYTVTMTGNSNFHYDEALKEFGGDGSYRIERWRELIDSDEKIPMDVPSEIIQYAVHYNTKSDFTQSS
ncbi:MAG: hypothetical protein KJT03_19650, partial [Verrucomicrobiae bacterium]|nr:hypothetical protein [Verrucomicrobiae bacterium]